MISTGDMPPISPQMYFQVQPFSRLMSRSFSVSSARDFVDVMDDLLLALIAQKTSNCRAKAIVQTRRLTSAG